MTGLITFLSFSMTVSKKLPTNTSFSYTGLSIPLTHFILILP